MSTSPNPLAAAAGMVAARRVRSPRPAGAETVDHRELGPILDAVRRGGVPALDELDDSLVAYRRSLETVDPDALDAPGALAFWVNLYNVGALISARDASVAGLDSMLRIPSVFSRRWTTIAGESLSLDDIEHGKVRRFGDPRIHAALVCGSVSCPTLRHEAFGDSALDAQLDEQMRRFVAAGGASLDRTRNVIQLGRVMRLPRRARDALLRTRRRR